MITPASAKNTTSYLVFWPPDLVADADADPIALSLLSKTSSSRGTRKDGLESSAGARIGQRVKLRSSRFCLELRNNLREVWGGNVARQSEKVVALYGSSTIGSEWTR